MPSNVNVHKDWHVKSARNRQLVYEAEQRKRIEDEKVEQIKERLRKEAETARFRKQQEELGLLAPPEVERIEWLYAGEPEYKEPEEEDPEMKSIRALLESDLLLRNHLRQELERHFADPAHVVTLRRRHRHRHKHSKG